MNDKYSVLYTISLTVVLNKDTYINIPSSDIVSIAFVHNYDVKTYPIIRIRLYTDIGNIQSILEFPDSIYVRTSMNGNIYMLNDNNESRTPVAVAGASPISFELKGYIENKNIPSSIADQYPDGLKKTSDLNDNVKCPIEIYCYDEQIVHNMQQKSQSIYKNMTLTSVLQDILVRSNVRNYSIDLLNNQTKYEQILIPNLNVTEAVSFFDIKYGLYHKGGQMYGDIDKMYICNSDVNNGTVPVPIYVRSAKNNDDECGMRKMDGVHNYQMIVNAPNVSVITETDIERVLNSSEMGAINLTDMGITIEELKKLFTESMDKSSARKSSGGISLKPIDTPQLLHKSNSEYVLPAFIARLDEKITKIDISGSGFDIGKLHMNTRYNIIFESPIRGLNINYAYRASYMTHVITNLSGSLFTAQTTMRLCSN